MNPQTWVASGHLGGFSDPLMDCKECHERFRADKIIEDFCQEKNIPLETSVDGWTNEEMQDFIAEHSISCPPAVPIILQISVSSTSCLKPSRV